MGDSYGATSSYLAKNGKPYICRMGEIHYSRVPEECWEEELLIKIYFEYGMQAGEFEPEVYVCADDNIFM